MLLCCWVFSSAFLFHPTAAATPVLRPGDSKPQAQSQAQAPSPPPALGEVADDIRQAKQAIRHTLEEMRRHSTLAGTLKPLVQKLMLSKQELSLLSKSIRATAHWEDLAVIVLLGWFTVPALQLPYDKMVVGSSKSSSSSSTLPSSSRFEDSLLYVVGAHVQHIGKIALLVYIVDVIKMFCVGVGIPMCQMSHLPHAFAQSAYTLYGANRLVALKKHYLRQYISRHPETFGRAKLLNRLADAAIYGLAVFVVLSILQVEMGVAMHSILAFGSVGTLALGLASQGIVSQILHGLLLASSDRIYEGDSIQFATTGQSGTIVHLGWLETVVRGSDEVMRSIPNAELLKQHVSNLSRVRYSQVKQILRFKVKEASKLPALLQSIKDEIQLACPEVLTDGSRPFRAYWTDYGTGPHDGSSFLEVVVDAHFAIKPTSEQYWENRQRVLQAIHRAIQMHQVELFAASPVAHAAPTTARHS